MLASRLTIRTRRWLLCAVFVFANVSTTFAQPQLSWTYDHNNTGLHGEGSVSGTSAHFSVSYPGYVDIVAYGQVTGGSFTYRKSVESIPDAVGVYADLQFDAYPGPEVRISANAYRVGQSVSGAIEFSPAGNSCPNGLCRDHSKKSEEAKRSEDGASIYIPEGDTDVDIEQGPSVANDTTGAYLVSLPVDSTYGVNQPVYYETPQVAAPNHYSPSAYFFGSETRLAFTTFNTPEGMPGDTSHIVIDDGTTLTPYTPGTTFTFTKPTMAFALRGLDTSVTPPDNVAFPYLWTATYQKAGPAIIWEAAYPVQTAPGDFNRDGVVDGADFVVWRKNGGTASDYNTWRNNFGQNWNPGGGGLGDRTVPEPATIVLLFAAVVAIVAITRHR